MPEYKIVENVPQGKGIRAENENHMKWTDSERYYLGFF